MSKAQDAVFQTIYDEGMKRGREAAAKCQVAPMVVQQHANPFDDNSPVRQEWVVPDGPCGFAWVLIRPANSPFANWLKKNNLGRKRESGGVDIWIGEHRQSIMRKYAHACAMADYFSSVGIKAYAQSRDD